MPNHRHAWNSRPGRRERVDSKQAALIGAGFDLLAAVVARRSLSPDALEVEALLSVRRLRVLAARVLAASTYPPCDHWIPRRRGLRGDKMDMKRGTGPWQPGRHAGPCPSCTAYRSLRETGRELMRGT